MDGILIEDLTEQTSLAESDNLIVGGSDANKITVANVISALKDLGLLNELGNKIFYATCSTAAATAAKVATTTEDGFTLTTGVAVAVRFTNINTASSPTLNVNSTGAKSMVYGGNTANASTAMTTYMWGYLDIVIFVYNGSNWIAVNKRTATTALYGLTKLTDSTSSTSTTTAATPNSVKTAYDAAVAAQETANELNSNKSNVLKTQVVTISISSFSGNTTYSNYVSAGYDVSLSGYTAIGVVGWNHNNAMVHMCRADVDEDSQTLIFELYNTSSATLTSVTIRFRILYVKND